MEPRRGRENPAVPPFHPLMIRGGELRVLLVDDYSSLPEQPEVFFARESERPEVEISTSLKKPSYSPKLGMDLSSGTQVAKPYRSREKFKGLELGGAKVDDHLKEKGGENDRRRV